MKELQKKFSFSYDQLTFKVGEVVGAMTRDETEFTARGITTIDRDAFEADGNAFEIFPDDDFYQGQITTEVQAKNILRESSYIKVRTLASQIAQVFGKSSGAYRQLGIKDLINKSDSYYLAKARSAARLGEELLAELAAAGVTQTQLDAITTEAQDLEDKMHAIGDKTRLRDDKTEERVTLANALYDNLAKYCAIGKSIWEDVSESKYNDYVINPTVNHGLSKVQNLMAGVDPASPNEAVLVWDPVVDATEYEIYQSQVAAGNPAGEYEINQSTPNTTETITIVAGFTYYWKVRGKSPDKIGYFSDSASLTV